MWLVTFRSVRLQSDKEREARGDIQPVGVTGKQVWGREGGRKEREGGSEHRAGGSGAGGQGREWGGVEVEVGGTEGGGGSGYSSLAACI